MILQDLSPHGRTLTPAGLANYWQTSGSNLQTPSAPLCASVFVHEVMPSLGQRRFRIASLIETCKMNGVEPYAWLKDTLEKIAASHPNSRIDHTPALELHPAVKLKAACLSHAYVLFAMPEPSCLSASLQVPAFPVLSAIPSCDPLRVTRRAERRSREAAGRADGLAAPSLPANSS